MIVVADTSPINYLLLISEIEVVPRLYGRIIIPRAVADELASAAAPEIARRWIAAPPNWVEIRRPAADGVPLAALLDAGERQAIAISLECGADLLMMDDWAGRCEAERQGIQVIGALGVLVAAARHGMLDPGSAVARLRSTNFRVSENLLRAVLPDE